jgi:hypothetical protein
MDTITETFTTPNPPTLSIDVRSGSLTIDTDDTSTTVVELDGHNDSGADLARATLVEQRGDTIVVRVPKRGPSLFGRSPRLDVRITAPHGTSLAVGTGSADVVAKGRYHGGRVDTGSGDVHLGVFDGALRVQAGSADVTIDEASADLDVKTGSGNVRIGRTGSAASFGAGSGDLDIGHAAGDVKAKTGSGNISLGEAEADLDATTGSGSIRAGRVRRGRVKARAASGSIHVGVATGTAAWLDVQTVSGTARSELEASDEPAADADTVELQLNTVSGNITIVRA